MSKPRKRPGRPRKIGAQRYPSGQVRHVKVEKNARVIENRERLLGSLNNLEKADHPLDLALVRGWITEDQHKAGFAFARMHRQACLGSPVLDRGGLRETLATSQFEGRGVRDWTPEETVEVFDAVFNKPPPSEVQGKAEHAMSSWLKVCALMTPEERQEVSLVCVEASWPQWVIHRASGHFNTPWERKRDILTSGLDKIVKALRPPTPATQLSEAQRRAEAEAPVFGPIREETTNYVTPEGDHIRTVVRRSRLLGEA